jgi:hypothetical protein
MLSPLGKEIEMSNSSKWFPIKRGDGKVTGYIEMFWHKATGQWMTVPGVSKFRNA